MSRRTNHPQRLVKRHSTKRKKKRGRVYFDTASFFCIYKEAQKKRIKHLYRERPFLPVFAFFTSSSKQTLLLKKKSLSKKQKDFMKPVCTNQNMCRGKSSFKSQSLTTGRLKRDCTAWTCVSASTALCALVWVDRILVALRDSTYRTLVDTCAASNTIVTNYISHSSKILKL